MKSTKLHKDWSNINKGVFTVAKNKYYAVKKGRVTGIYNNWNECQLQISGFSGAIYKGFYTYEEAQVYMGDIESNKEINSSLNHDENAQDTYEWSISKSKEPLILVAYVDGSYKVLDSGTVYSGGGIIVENGEIVERVWGYGNKKGLAEMRNVSGELLATLKTIEYVIKNRKDTKKLIIVHDFLGIACWPNKEWKCKNEYTRQYADYVNKMRTKIEIEFKHVKGHSSNPLNEEADTLCGYVSQCIKDTREINMDDYLLNHSYIESKLKKINKINEEANKKKEEETSELWDRLDKNSCNQEEIDDLEDLFLIVKKMKKRMSKKDSVIFLEKLSIWQDEILEMFRI